MVFVRTRPRNPADVRAGIIAEKAPVTSSGQRTATREEQETFQQTGVGTSVQRGDITLQEQEQALGVGSTATQQQVDQAFQTKRLDQPLTTTAEQLRATSPTPTTRTGPTAAVRRRFTELDIDRGIERNKQLFTSLGKGAFKVIQFGIPAPTKAKAEEIFKGVRPITKTILKGAEIAYMGRKGKKSTFKDIEKRVEFVEGAAATTISFPKEKPITTASLILLPAGFRAVETGGKLVAGKVLVETVKRVPTKFIPVVTKTAVTTGKATVGVTKVGLGTTFVVSKVKKVIGAPTPRAKGEVVGETVAEVGALAVGTQLTKTPTRLQERYEAEVEGPLTVASKRVGTFKEGGKTVTFKQATRENIEFAQQLGKAGVRLSAKDVQIKPKRNVPFRKVQGVSKKEAAKLQKFFKERESFVKGSTAQETFLNKKLSKEFVRERGGKFADIDAAVKGRVQPKTKVKIDVKELGEAQRITGARTPQTTKSGIKVQAFQEQSFRKSVGGIQQLSEQVRPRLGKDTRDLLFNIKQAQLEGVTGLTKPRTTIEAAISGESGVTLPLINVRTTKTLIPRSSESGFILSRIPTGRAATSAVVERKISSSPRIKSPTRITIPSFIGPLPRSRVTISRPKSIIPPRTSPKPPKLETVSGLITPPSKRPSGSGRAPPSRTPPSAPPSIPQLTPSKPPSAPPSKLPILKPPRIPLFRTPPRTPPLKRFKLELQPKKAAKRKVTRKTRFQPSVVGIEYKFKAPLKRLEEKKLTGLEIREIPI